ncbi:MAG: MFS transporter [Acidimicrobiia bacterium]
MRAVVDVTVAAGEAGRWTEPWDGLVLERPAGGELAGDGRQGRLRFEAERGPFDRYGRTVTVTPAADGRLRVRSEVDFRLAVPYFSPLLAIPVRRALRVPGAPSPWWGPADRLDRRAASVLATLCAASVVAGFLGTSITQTITYAVDDFGIDGDRAQGTALAVVRLAMLLSLGLVAAADRRGRRRMIVGCIAAGCALAGLAAVTPSLALYTAVHTVMRGFSTALAILVAVVAAEEMPAGARAFAASVLGMSGALGAGICVMALPLADLGESGWRLIFLLPLLALPAVPGLARRLPESRRFVAPHGRARFAGHGRRLALLATSTFLVQIFLAPASQLQNEFLRDERGYSAFGITLFSICTNTPAGIGVLVGARVADQRGRRLVGALALVGGVVGTVTVYLTTGTTMWVASLVGGIVAGATIPALGVYGPELFPTALRARANGVLGVTGVLGAAAGLLAAGALSDGLGSLGRAMAVLAVGPVALAVLVVTRYPETAGLELEELNPEDATAPVPPT